jgi:hypothetical protein
MKGDSSLPFPTQANNDRMKHHPATLASASVQKFLKTSFFSPSDFSLLCWRNLHKLGLIRWECHRSLAAKKKKIRVFLVQSLIFKSKAGDKK